MKKALRLLLQNTAAITALVPAARINWGEHPQGAGSPYIHMMTASGGNQGRTMQGGDGMYTSRIQIDVYAPTYGQAQDIAEVLKDFLHMYRNGSFRLIEHEGGSDGREGGTNEAERLYRFRLDFTVNWRK